jgi:adenosine deaminase
MNTHHFPKIDLHRHLEGALRLQTILELAQHHHRTLPAHTTLELAHHAQVLKPMDSLQAVLDAFDLFQHTFLSYEAVERIAFEAVEDAALDNIRLLELRFSPDFMARPASLDWDEMMNALLKGVHAAQEKYDVVVGLIAIVSRSYGPQSADNTAAFAINWRQQLVGFDLADSEEQFPASAFAPAIKKVRHAGLGVTIHSGENVGPEHIRDAIELLGARRIGHGVSLFRDTKLMNQVAKAGICIESCPTSNVRTRAVESLASHPAAQFLSSGVAVCLNSDDPGLFDITLSGELDLALGAMGFDEAMILKSTRYALEASFVDQIEKDTLKAKTPEWHWAD